MLAAGIPGAEWPPDVSQYAAIDPMSCHSGIRVADRSGDKRQLDLKGQHLSPESQTPRLELRTGSKPAKVGIGLGRVGFAADARSVESDREQIGAELDAEATHDALDDPALRVIESGGRKRSSS